MIIWNENIKIVDQTLITNPVFLSQWCLGHLWSLPKLWHRDCGNSIIKERFTIRAELIFTNKDKEVNVNIIVIWCRLDLQWFISSKCFITDDNSIHIVNWFISLILLYHICKLIWSTCRLAAVVIHGDHIVGGFLSSSRPVCSVWLMGLMKRRQCCSCLLMREKLFVCYM